MKAMSKFPAITKDIPVPLSLGLHVALLSAVLYAGMQLQKLSGIAEKQWSVNMEEAGWDKFQAMNSDKYPGMKIPDVQSIRKSHAGIVGQVVNLARAAITQTKELQAVQE